MKKKTIILLIVCIAAVLITVGICFFVESKNIYKDADIKQQEAEDMAKAVLSSDIKSDISGELIYQEITRIYQPLIHTAYILKRLRFRMLA